jgi:TonB family protein
MFRAHLNQILVTALAFSAVTVFAQTSVKTPPTPSLAPVSPTAQPSITDPAQILAIAAQVNGLVGPDVKPWHLRLTYETFDNEGKQKSAGTFEEWWASEKKHKSKYVFQGAFQTDYTTENGLFRSGSQDSLGDTTMRIEGDLLQPIPASFDNYSFDLRERTLGQAHLRCIFLHRLGGDTLSVPFMPGTYCLDANKPTLRVKTSADGVHQAIFNHLLPFQDHYLASDIRIMKSGKPLLTIVVEKIESLSTIEPIDFTPPADAIHPLLPKLVEILPGDLSVTLLHAVSPEYPPVARTMGLEGTVVVQAIIGKDGHTRNSHAVSGPKLLQKAALDAVNGYLYRPILFNGQPVELTTTVNVTFKLAAPHQY